MKTLLSKTVCANQPQRGLTKNKSIITAAILRFSETDIINGNIISHEEAKKSFEKILS
jgi:hypothetical protein